MRAARATQVELLLRAGRGLDRGLESDATERPTRHRPSVLRQPTEVVWLGQQAEEVNRKRVRRLMRIMGLEAIYPKPRLSTPGQGPRIYPYLLRGVKIEKRDQVWNTDITYIPMATGFMYLTAVIDWYSR